ncbi:MULTISPECIES: hypothetical protein [unclassified Crossiella]|uniref:hypothetical protein n=1 Tax=unclassified Crossiella TaxID=2620835 RepID=UPI00200005AB|nr:MULTISPECIES: hypothetical protein [unclassified Crossiella]MCK2240903.1 hypothetical protein [Crossiella sp. S99.2]MCK2253953.1 hypothetical protein [Crossiella sp. S99.1]
MYAVRALCRSHPNLDSLALAKLAPIAAAGHTAHLVLFIADNTDRWIAGQEEPPQFVIRSRLATTMSWTQIQEHVADPAVRRLLAGHHRAGQIVTAHLVGLAEGMIRRIVRQVRTREFARTVVADLSDMLNTGRAAVAQGIWAYDPARPSGAHYLRAWIEEHVKRDLTGLTYQVSVPARTHARFLRMAGMRATLAEQLGREPTDTELLAQPDAVFTQADIDDERRTRMRRRHTGLGMPSLMRGVRSSEVGASEVLLLRPAFHDRSDTRSEDWEEEALQRVDDRGGVATSGWRVLLDSLQLGPAQRDIIARSLGLPPHEHLPESERTERAIGAQFGLGRGVVHNILTTLRNEMSQPGGRIHHLVAGLNDEDLEGLGLQPFARLLGPLQEAESPPRPIPVMLTKPLRHNRSVTPTRRRGLLVRYECHGPCGWAGYERASGPRFVLPKVPCPDCGNGAVAVQHRKVGQSIGREAG